MKTIIIYFFSQILHFTLLYFMNSFRKNQIGEKIINLFGEFFRFHEGSQFNVTFLPVIR